MDYWEYKVVGININLSEPPPNAEIASNQLGGMSKDFIKNEFPEYYKSNKSSNIALQCQNLINIYGQIGWEHYFQGQLANLIVFYFKRKIEDDSVLSNKLSAEQESLIQSLDESQRP